MGAGHCTSGVYAAARRETAIIVMLAEHYSDKVIDQLELQESSDSTDEERRFTVKLRILPVDNHYGVFDVYSNGDTFLSRWTVSSTCECLRNCLISVTRRYTGTRICSFRLLTTVEGSVCQI